MKYKKGTFVVIPNKQYLKGKPSEMQSIYFWLCEHADDNGGCFPTKEQISLDGGCSHNTTDKYLKQLVDEGFLRITNRRKKGSKEFTSNHYQVLIISQSPKMVQPTTNNGITCPPNIGLETNPNINSNHITTLPKVELVFNYKEKMQKLLDSSYKPDKIRWLYFTKKNMVFENKSQWDTAMKQTYSPAKALDGYNSNQIETTMNYCQDMWKDNWTLYAVVKQISNVVNKK